MKKSLIFLVSIFGVATSLSAMGHYVCYEDRNIIHIEGNQYYMEYIGCQISRKSCESIGLRRFGHYPNNYETREALRRCIKAKPRFVD
jgi:hypothetical protein